MKTRRGYIIFCFTLFILKFSYTSAQDDSAIIKIDSFYAPSVALQLKYTAILPAAYYKTKRAYPVVYLLHGHTGNYTSWISYAKLPVSLATRYNCIIILPDAGNSWYVNWTGQTDQKPHRWQDMVVVDLLPAVEKRYRTINTKAGRAIGGLSMGGFGALSIGLANTEKFAFVFSSAGAIDFCNYIRDEFKRDTIDWNSPVLWSEDKKVVGSKGFSSWRERTPQGLVFKHPEDADLFDPLVLLQKADSSLLPFIHVDCGDKDDHLKPALRFVEKLREKNAPHSLLLLPGNHEVPYWQQAIELSFLIMQQQGFLR